jgi:putative hydrolases of HD superfamily
MSAIRPSLVATNNWYNSSMDAPLTSLFDFVSLTHDIRAVKRSMWVKSEETFENDSEHSYQLAMVAMYIIESQKLDLDTHKAMAMALVHDILEVHAGDTPVFGSAEQLQTKQQREQAAVAQLKQQWPDLSFMHRLIEEYELRQSAKSAFIYALDKLLPIINNYLDDGRNWKHSGRTLDDITAAKDQKVAVDTTVNDYYQQLITLLRQRPHLFSNGSVL